VRLDDLSAVLRQWIKVEVEDPAPCVTP